MIKLYLVIYVLLVMFFGGEKNSVNRVCKKDNHNKITSESAKSAFTSGYQLDSLINIHVMLFDTTDCVFKIFSTNKNLNYFESKATKTDQNKNEISVISLGEIFENDTILTSESYFNKLIGIEFKKYYESGKIKSCGFQIGENESIGKWKYFSASGELDSISDHNSLRSMTFCKFFEIAHAFGMVGENSRMPERKRFNQIADSLGLKNCNSSILFSNPNWRDLDFYPIAQEEKKGHFTCKISYSLWHSNEWTVEKQFNIQGKSLGFALSIYPTTNEICIYETFYKK